MTLLSVLHYPDERLRQKAQPVTVFDAALQTLIADMFETMYEQQGAGLAATQVNIQQQIIVMDISATRKEPRCFINLEILSREGVQYEAEGCLSVPSIYERVERAAKIQVRALDQTGQPLSISAEGLLAVCMQHEKDHLDGILFIDHLSRLKQERARKKMSKLKRYTY